MTPHGVHLSWTRVDSKHPAGKQPLAEFLLAKGEQARLNLPGSKRYFQVTARPAMAKAR